MSHAPAATSGLLTQPAIRRPEILAPAGTREMMHAAIENGADAIYFGLEAFNARLRAHNFSIAELPETMAWLHERGVRGYVTMNTLIFAEEMTEAADVLRACSDAGVDAVLIQDLGLARLAAELVPCLPVHASTQMTLSCAESIDEAEELGLRLERVVAPRETNLRELQKITSAVQREIEVFVHGAICVAYSGQCLTSEALGGRSANRGECAQACRLPYDLIVDGEKQDLGDVRYLLSPKDLAAVQDLAELTRIGIASLKIEGRLKTPQYVAATVRSYRAALDTVFSGGALEGETLAQQLSRIEQQALPLVPPQVDKRMRNELAMTFSRGFTGGYLHETNHQAVVEGRFPKKRGLLLGTVIESSQRGVILDLVPGEEIKAGDGVVFDAGRPDEDEVGGRVYGVEPVGGITPATRAGSKPNARTTTPRTSKSSSHHGARSAARTATPSQPQTPQQVRVWFDPSQWNPRRVHIGDRVWKTSDPVLDRELSATFEGDTIRHRRPLDITARLNDHGELLCIFADPVGECFIGITDSEPAAPATQHGLSEKPLREQLGRLGGTPFFLRRISLAPEVLHVHVPFSRLNDMRRKAVDALLDLRRARGRGRGSRPEALAQWRANIVTQRPDEHPAADSSRLSVLCRTLDQAVALANHPGVDTIYIDIEDVMKLSGVRDLIPSSSARIVPATLRIVKPGEATFVRAVLAARPDAVLVRNLAAWRMLRQMAPETPLIGDYSLNVANDLTASLVMSRGLQYVTPSYDLNMDQLMDLVRRTPPAWFEVTVHQRIPMFHMEHCVFCRFLSTGTDFTNCGRPCEKHDVRLRDRVGYEHPLKADSGCRNTVFQAAAQSASAYIADMLTAGLRRFRIEFLDETPDAARHIVDEYLPVIQGRADGSKLWHSLRAISKLGVTKGTLDHD